MTASDAQPELGNPKLGKPKLGKPKLGEPKLGEPKLGQPELGPLLRRLIPIVVAACFLMEQLDQTIIATAIPDMAASLGAPPVRLNLAITSYTLSLAVFIPISGWMADRFGARSVICWAFAVFTAGSALCGLSDSLPMLVAMRVLQGLGGAMMTPVGRLILFRSFPKDQLVNAMAWVSIPSLLGPTLGPVLGGLITTYANWRWIFLVNIPFGLIAIGIAAYAVRDAPVRTRALFDIRGFALCALGLALLQFFLETVGRGEVARWVEVSLLVGGAAALLAYRAYAARFAQAVLDLTLFRIRTFRVGSIAGGVCRIGINAPPFLLPLLFQLGFGFRPIHSGLLTFVSSLGALAVRPLSARLLRTFGFRRLLTVNALVSAVCIAGFSLFRADTPELVILAAIALFGVVRSIQFNGIQMLSYADMPPGALSRATSLGSVVQQLTMGLGVSVGAALLALLAGPGHTPNAAEFGPVFLGIAVLPLVAIPGFLGLAPADGAEVSRHRLA